MVGQTPLFPLCHIGGAPYSYYELIVMHDLLTKVPRLYFGLNKQYHIIFSMGFCLEWIGILQILKKWKIQLTILRSKGWLGVHNVHNSMQRRGPSILRSLHTCTCKWCLYIYTIFLRGGGASNPDSCLHTFVLYAWFVLVWSGRWLNLGFCPSHIPQSYFRPKCLPALMCGQISLPYPLLFYNLEVSHWTRLYHVY
jgi:hypothetical protein